MVMLSLTLKICHGTKIQKTTLAAPTATNQYTQLADWNMRDWHLSYTTVFWEIGALEIWYIFRIPIIVFFV